MGLFTKKPKTSAPEAPAVKAAKPGKPDKAPAAPAEKAPKPAKGKKIQIDPMEFLALRTELVDLRARLEATEQSKAIVETRLAALDATTTAIANAGAAPGGDDVRARINELQAQLATVAEAAANASANAENASAKATAAATVASNAAAAPAQIAPLSPDPEVLARIDELAAQLQSVQAVQAAPAAPSVDPALAQHVAALAAKLEAAPPPGPDAGLLARLDQLSARLDATPEAGRLLALEARVGELAAAPAVPAAPAAPVADPETLARIEQLAERVAAVDTFGAQLAQLNARVSAQAEFGAQLSSLRDRITELSTDTDDRRAAALAATGDADLRDRVNAIADRIGAGDNIAAQIAQLAERVAANDATARQATEQVSAIEQRLQAVSTELANQVSELGRDIDGLAAHSGDAADGTVSDELIDSLKTAQVKLAAEQARYEIAFRQDLAALAEQVRHTRKP